MAQIGGSRDEPSGERRPVRAKVMAERGGIGARARTAVWDRSDDTDHFYAFGSRVSTDAASGSDDWNRIRRVRPGEGTAHGLSPAARAWRWWTASLGGVGLLFAVVLLAADRGTGSRIDLVSYGVVGLLFAAAGAHLRLRRPASRVGLLLVAAAVVLVLQGLRRSSDPVLLDVGSFLVDPQVPLVVHAILAFPTGHLTQAVDRWTVVAAYLYWTPVHALEHVGPVVLAVGDSLLAAALLVVMTRRLRDGTAAYRWSFRPLWFGTVLAIATAVLAYSSLSSQGPAVSAVSTAGYAALPVAFVIALERGRRARQHVIAEVLPSSGSALTWSLRYLLHDPSLQVVAGPVVTAGVDRVVTPLTRGGRQVGALVHDPTTLAEPELLAAAAAAAAVAVENQALLATVSTQLAEVQESRRRIVQAVSEERQRIERNLHDGAQQRLLATALLLRRGERRPELSAAAELIGTAAAEVELALAEVRALARGLYPPGLVELGLVRAVRELAESSTTVPVEVTAPATVEAPLPVSATAYFAILEGVTNAVRHAQPTSVQVSITVRDGHLSVAVRDDGGGGATLVPEGGLLGLRDRAEALGGTLELSSHAGAGTTVTVSLPLGAA